MASPSPEQIIESQRQDWNRVAGGWEKWDRFFDEQMAFLNHRLVGDARLRAGLRVLDLGSGTGYPALLTAQTVGASGGVIGIDLAEQMLEAATRKAAVLKLSNVTFRTGDVTTLPFEAASFDAVISRFCLMFLPEIPKAVAEIARVLKPDTWVAAAVWSAPDKNPYLKIPIDIIKQFLEIPLPIHRLRGSSDWRNRVSWPACYNEPGSRTFPMMSFSAMSGSRHQIPTSPASWTLLHRFRIYGPN